jgi:hypothetical protein
MTLAMRPLLPALLCLGLLSTRAGALAQDVINYPAPKPPFVAPVPENAEWTINVEYPKEPKPSPDAPKRNDWRYVEVKTTKVGKVKRDLITSRDGVKQEHWFVDSMLFRTDSLGEVSVSDLRAAEAADPDEEIPSVPSGFPGVGWLKLDNYVDIVTFEKRPSYHFLKGEAEAWVDAETKLPVAYRRGNVLYRFTFGPRPTGPLVMPPAYQTALDTIRRMYGTRK